MALPEDSWGLGLSMAPRFSSKVTPQNSSVWRVGDQPWARSAPPFFGGRPRRFKVDGMVYEHVREQVEASFVDLGERELKNIARPVRLSCGHRPPRDSKFGCNKARIGGRNPRQALDCGLALSKHEWRPRAGLISPTHLRGHITALSKLSQLFVIARNSSSEIARRLLGSDLR